MTLSEVSRRLGICKQRVQQLIKFKKLKAKNIGDGQLRARWEVTEEALQNYLKIKGVRGIMPPEKSRGTVWAKSPYNPANGGDKLPIPTNALSTEETDKQELAKAMEEYQRVMADNRGL